MIWNNSAPSNIALIKYMGKLNFAKNIPTNPSLSYTLDHLRTFVEIERSTDDLDRWEPLKKDGCFDVVLSEKGQLRFLKHFQKLKDVFQVKDHFIVRSVNNFPSDSGLASSASSFAALTQTAAELFDRMDYKNTTDLKLYELSREGSGSSCRSFFSPWGLWNKEEVFGLDLKIKDLYHQVVIVDALKKEVSSGEAHKRVETSLVNVGRAARASQRLNDLIAALNQNEWDKAFEVCWAEFWDMHTLFETSQPSFRYMSPKSHTVLDHVQKFWQENKDGPLVTMDAGPNVHLLWHRDQDSLKQKFRLQLTSKKDNLVQEFQILENS